MPNDTDKQLSLQNDWNQNLAVAEEMIKTRLLPSHITTPQQAVMIILMGKELGIGPISSLRNIYVIQQKPALTAQLMLELIYRSDKCEDIKIESSDNSCTVTMKRKGMSPHSETFGIKEATALGLIARDNYKKQLKNMLKWRALSACARVVFSEVINGLYTPEEIESHSDIAESAIQVERVEDITESEETYDTFLKEKFDLIRNALSVATEPEQVANIKKGFASDLKMMIEADRAAIEAEINAKYNELITGSKPLSILEQYKKLAGECKDLETLRAWFKGLQKEMITKLSKEEFSEMVEYCKALFPAPKPSEKDPLEEVISLQKAKILEAIVKKFKPAFNRHLKNLYNVQKIGDIKQIWYDDILHWVKNYKAE